MLISLEILIYIHVSSYYFYHHNYHTSHVYLIAHTSRPFRDGYTISIDRCLHYWTMVTQVNRNNHRSLCVMYGYYTALY